MFTQRSLHNTIARITKPSRAGAALLLLLLSASGLLLSLPASAQNSTQMLQDQTIYVPFITGGDVTGGQSMPTPVATLATGARVYGLVGQLQRASGQTYTYYITTANSGRYALAGETPEIEQQIDALARSSDTPNVKVWGEVQSPEAAGEPPLIVVTGILGTEATVPTPIAGEAVSIAVVKFDQVNLYSGPASTFPVSGKVVLRQACEITGRNQASSWLQLTCADGQQGWVDARLVDIQGDVSVVAVLNATTPTPIPTPIPPTPTPTPAVFNGWRTEFYNNANLAGAPVARADVPAINFNWGNSGPSQVSSDNFSVRFSRRISVTPAYYEFTAVADDGIRVWIDGRLIINAWPANPSQSYVVGQVLTGEHDIQVDYYELSGLAKVSLSYTTVSNDRIWQATYYQGVNPTGNPAFTQQEPVGPNPLDYNWSTGSAPSTALGPNILGNDYWSARWQEDFPFDGGNFVFRANVDDGIRLYLDGLLVLDYWRDGYKEVNNRVLGIGPGQHTIIIEYYERAGNASIEVWWYRDSAYTGPQ